MVPNNSRFENVSSLRKVFGQRLKRLLSSFAPTLGVRKRPCAPVSSGIYRKEREAIPANCISEHTFAKVCNSGKKVSVIYNYYEKEATISESLESLRKQKWRECSPEDVEIIVVDDGTSGEPIGSRLPIEVIYVWQRRFGYGICRAKNTGARIANGQYFVFLDPDMIVNENYLDSVVRGFCKYGDYAVQCGLIWDYHFPGSHDPRLEFGVWELPNRQTRRFYQVAGGNMAVSRRLFFETPGFDEDLIYGGVEDLLFGYHVGKIEGTTVVFNTEMEGRHIPHPPSEAHADTEKSWNIVRRKWPEFYQQYIVQGLR
jgi:glycosyltransferase involved in cell wall biosynthesis